MYRQFGIRAALIVCVAAGLWAAGPAALVAADSDNRASREREMLHRAQEALRQSQEESAELGRAKTDAEQKLKDAAGQLESARNASRSAQSALKSQLQASATAQADLTQQLERAKQQIAALTSQQQDTAKRLSTRESELAQTKQDLQQSKTANASCEDKNLKLYEYSAELMQRYQKKGVWASLRQKDPVLGLKQVEVENVVQEYQEKLDSQKLTPAAVSATAPTNPTPAASKPAH